MTARETEKLAKVEQKVDDLGDDVAEIKGDIKAIMRTLSDQNEKFISKRAAAWFSSFLVAVGAAVGAIITAIRTHH